MNSSTTILQNIRNYTPSDTLSHPRRHTSSTMQCKNLTPHKEHLVIQICCLLGTCYSQSTHWSIQCPLPCTMTEQFLEWNWGQQNLLIPKNPSLHILCILPGSQCTGKKEQIIIMVWLWLKNVLHEQACMQIWLTWMETHKIYDCRYTNVLWLMHKFSTKRTEIWDQFGM